MAKEFFSMFHILTKYCMTLKIVALTPACVSHLGESNTERREKYQPIFQKKAPNNTGCPKKRFNVLKLNIS